MSSDIVTFGDEPYRRGGVILGDGIATFEAVFQNFGATPKGELRLVILVEEEYKHEAMKWSDHPYTLCEVTVRMKPTRRRARAATSDPMGDEGLGGEEADNSWDV